MRTLIVEDDPGSSLLLREILKEYGPVDAVNNGQAAVKRFAAALNAGNGYDLVLLDIMMPEMNGQTALREIRNIEKQNNIEGLDAAKIIMETALNDSKNILDSFRRQSDGYLVKPIDKQKLLDLLRQHKLI